MTAAVVAVAITAYIFAMRAAWLQVRRSTADTAGASHAVAGRVRPLGARVVGTRSPST